jgi:hypothetical protein
MKKEELFQFGMNEENSKLIEELIKEVPGLIVVLPILSKTVISSPLV